MASEATKMAVRGNMHIDTRVIEVADFKYEVKFDLRGCLEAVVAHGVTHLKSEATLETTLVVPYCFLKCMRTQSSSYNISNSVKNTPKRSRVLDS